MIIDIMGAETIQFNTRKTNANHKKMIVHDFLTQMQCHDFDAGSHQTKG